MRAGVPIVATDLPSTRESCATTRMRGGGAGRRQGAGRRLDRIRRDRALAARWCTKPRTGRGLQLEGARAPGTGLRAALTAPAPTSEFERARILGRHGETEWNAARRLRAAPIPGCRHAAKPCAALAVLLAGEPIEAIYTSTLRRTRDTAGRWRRSSARGAARAEMDEMSYGLLEGRQPHDPDPAIQALFAARKADAWGSGPRAAKRMRKCWRGFCRSQPNLRARTRRARCGHRHRATNRVLWSVLMGVRSRSASP